MNFAQNDEMRSLYARLDDLSQRAGHGELSVTPFLSPRELHCARQYLLREGRASVCWGGYESAERCRMYILPDYMETLATDESARVSADAFGRALSDFGYASDISTLKIIGSGYRKLTHRDFLGSLLGLGLERDVLGDILVLGDEGREAIIFCDGTISEYIEIELSHVANDKVSVLRPGADTWEIPCRRVQPIRDTVASPRLDAVVAALCDLSRERAQSAVRDGLVEIDFEREERPDRTVLAPALISVRGIGRFRVIGIGGMTRKGRYRLEAEKYV